MKYQFTEDDKKTLLLIARKSIHAVLNRVPYQPLSSIPLNDQQCGAFVTLYCCDELRGCLGRFDPQGLPIGSLITRLAAECATHDYRFQPLQQHELSYLDIHISILTPPVLTTGIQNIQIGRHGVKIQGTTPSGEKRMGTLLPQVAVEQKWDIDQFVMNTCIKAGLAKDAWKDPETEIYIYETDIFCDSDYVSPPFE